MRTKRILFGILVLFAVLALSANSLHAAEQESSSVAVSDIGTLNGSGLGITDDFAVTDDGCVLIKYDGVGDPDIDITPMELEAILKPGEIVSKTLNICNDGDGVLMYSNISIFCDAPERKTAAIGALGVEKIEKGIGAISAGEEIGYDDGEANDGYSWPSAGFGMGVHFTVANPEHRTPKTARFYIDMNDSVSDNSFDWKVLGWTGSMPGSVIASGTATPVDNGWHDVDVGDITVPEDFVIAMYWRQGHAPYLGYDTDAPIDKRSWDYTDTGSRWDEEDYMIRAVMKTGTSPPPTTLTMAIRGRDVRHSCAR